MRALEAMRRRGVAILYAVAALLLLGPTLRLLVHGLVVFPVRGCLYLAMALAFHPLSGLSIVFGAWFASIAWRCAARPDDDCDGALRAAEWIATVVAALLVAIFWSLRHAPPDADRTFAVASALATAAFLLVAIGSRSLR